MSNDPSAAKYQIRARIAADGVIEKPDVVGAVFGQTEGLLGDELDLRDLQKSGRIGRIEVDIDSRKGKSEGEIVIPSSLDQVETAILASGLETVDRIGPVPGQDRGHLGRGHPHLQAPEGRRAREGDPRASSRRSSKGVGLDLTESVRKAVQVEEITSYGPEHLPAGPNIDQADALIVVEGRSDVLNLLRCGIKNCIAVEGTSVPQTVKDLSRGKTVTVFTDGDRAGELILQGDAPDDGHRLRRPRPARQRGRGADAEAARQVPAEQDPHQPVPRDDRFRVRPVRRPGPDGGPPRRGRRRRRRARSGGPAAMTELAEAGRPGGPPTDGPAGTLPVRWAEAPAHRCLRHPRPAPAAPSAPLPPEVQRYFDLLGGHREHVPLALRGSG